MEKTCRTRAGTKVIILMEDDTHIFGVYDGGTELFPARWDKKGYFVTQEEGKEFKCALDLMLT